MTGQDGRSAYWDNLKVFLIFLVVLGHYYLAEFVYGTECAWILPRAVISVVYMVHMPLFAFVSGWFSKDTDRARRSAVRTVLPAYLFWNLVCMALDHFISGAPWRNFVLDPVSHIWYLAALFIWRYFSPELSEIRFPWAWALGLSLLSTVTGTGKNLLLLAGCLTYAPFFLLGLWMPETRLVQIRRIPKVLCAAIPVLVFCAACFLLHAGCSVQQLGFFMIEPYNGLHTIPVLLGRYLLSAVLGVSIINLIPEKSCRLTGIGKNTMAPFLLHNLPGIRNMLYRISPFHGSMSLSMLWWAGWAVFAVLISSAAGRAVREKRKKTKFPFYKFLI